MQQHTYRVSVVYEIVVDDAKARHELGNGYDPDDVADQIWADNGPEISSQHYLGSIKDIDDGHLERV